MNADLEDLRRRDVAESIWIGIIAASAVVLCVLPIVYGGGRWIFEILGR